MNSIYFVFFSFQLICIFGEDFQTKYRPLREQCQRDPSDVECVKIKSKFLDLIKKCQKINTQEQFKVCNEVKNKLCAIFPSTCNKASTKRTISTTKQTKSTTKQPLTTTTTTKSTLTLETTKTTAPTMSNEEFVKVPVNPDELRTRGEYCVRHGKEKKCQDLLNNLKNTYSSCSKNKSAAPPTKPEQIDCHSFQTHLCKAFPKFPPCLKNKAQ